MSTPNFRTAGSTQSNQGAQTNRVSRVTLFNKPNAYDGECFRCDGLVRVGEGRLGKDSLGNWVVSHQGPCPTDVEGSGSATVRPNTRVQAPIHPLDPEFTPNWVNGEMLMDGVYTLSTAEGHRTLRLKTQRLDDDFMPGVQIVQYLSAPDNTHDYTSFGHIKNSRISIWKKHADNEALVRDVQAFLRDPSQAEKALHCYRCGRLLTTPESLALGLGSECANKGMA